MQIPHSIVIIGGGHMGGALATRWAESGIGEIHVVDRDKTRCAALHALNIPCHESLEAGPAQSSVIILAVKPQQFPSLTELLTQKMARSEESLLVSIMAGISLSALQKISPRAVRVMPNLPAQIGESMSVACAPHLASWGHLMVTHLFEAIGKLAWVDEEKLLHAATAISGSGPAYVFTFMEALEIAAVTQGLSPALARQLVGQTLRGAALLAERSPETAATLCQQVASPGGTTEAALRVFTKGQLVTLIADAVDAAARRSSELIG